MALKIVLFYNQVNRGWTETFYQAGGSAPTNPIPTWGKFFQAAIAFRAPLTTLYAVRFSDTLVNRAGISFPLGRLYSADTPSGVDPLADVASTDGVWKLYTGQKKTRTISIRGMRDGSVTRDQFGNDLPSTELLKGVEKFLNAGISLQLAIRVLTQPDGPPNNVITVDALDRNAASPEQTDVTLSEVPPVGWAVGNYIRFFKIPTNDLVGFPKSCPILKFSAATRRTFTIPYRLRGYNSYVPKRLSLMLSTVTYSNYETFDFVRFSERKTGRPFGSLRGRTRPVAVRQ